MPEPAVPVAVGDPEAEPLGDSCADDGPSASVLAPVPVAPSGDRPSPSFPTHSRMRSTMERERERAAREENIIVAVRARPLIHKSVAHSLPTFTTST